MTDTKWRIGKSFAKYSKQASASLDPSRKSLVIGGRAAGAVSEDDARLIAERIEGASFDGESLVIGAASDSEEMLSAILALAAALLRDEGRIHRWRGDHGLPDLRFRVVVRGEAVHEFHARVS